MPNFDHLLAAFDCGRLHLKNRITAAPIFTGLEFDANLTELVRFYERLAKDGVSMVTVCSGLVHKSGAPSKIWRVFNESLDIPRHRVITNTLRKHGCKSMLQLVHAGAEAKAWPVWSSSTIKRDDHASAWRAPNLIIRRIIEGCIRTALYAREAGYDGIELHAAERSLAAAFLSPATNHRRDVWGATQLARFKFVLDIVRGIRKAVGEDFVIGMHFNLMELTARGADWSEMLRLTQMLRIAGADYLRPEFDGPEDRIPTHQHPIPKNVWLPECRLLAENTTLAVIFNADLGTLEDAQKAIEPSDNMVAAFARTLVADGRFIRKSTGQVEGVIRPWIEHPEYGRIDDLSREQKLFCLSSPFLFNAFPQAFVPAAKKRSITVIGGGLSGMLFAVTAARRGHFVRLFEAHENLGGSLRYVGKIRQTSKIQTWINLLEKDLEFAGVEVHLNTKVDFKQLLSSNDTDLIVNASGSEPEIPDFPGIDSSNVVTYEELLGEDAPVGNRVAVLGVNPVSVTVCRYLLEQLEESEMTAEQWRKAWGIGDIRHNRGGILGVVPEIAPPLRQVYLVESSCDQIRDLQKRRTDRWELQWLLMRGAQTLRGVNIEAIDNYALRASWGERHEDRYAVRIDHLVVCSGAVPNTELSMRLSVAGRDVMSIGAAAQDSGYLSIYEAAQEAITKALEV